MDHRHTPGRPGNVPPWDHWVAWKAAHPDAFPVLPEWADDLARRGRDRRLVACTHGADCAVHPTAPGLHNFDG